MKKVLLATLALLTVLAAPASAQRDCPRIADIRNWWAINDRTLIVETTRRDRFRLNLIGTCFNLRWRNDVSFQSRGASRLSCLRPGDSVVNRDRRMGTARCAITRIERYTPEMEAQDKAASAAKPGGNP